MFHEGMTMIKLRRPMLLGEPDTFMAEVNKACDALGIVPGDPLVIARVPSVTRETPGAARRNDPATSKAAAASTKASAREQIVLDALIAAPKGLIGDDVWDICDPKHEQNRDSWVPRLGGLKKKGLARPTGEKRMGRHGHKQQVYVAVLAPSPDAEVVPDAEPEPATSLF